MRVILSLLFLLPTVSMGASADAMTALSNTSDYTYMWWAHGLRDERKVFNIQTSRYGLSFDFDAFALTHFGPIRNPPAEPAALTEDNNRIFSLPNAGLECRVDSGGRSYRVVKSATDYRDCKLIESGRWFQRRWLDELVFEEDAPPVTGLLEIAAWPDRVSFVFRVRANRAIPSATPSLVMIFPEGSRVFAEDRKGVRKGVCFEIKSARSCYACLTPDFSTSLTIDRDANQCTVSLTSGNWQAGEERSVCLIVYPMANARKPDLAELIECESRPAIVSASQVLPVTSPIEAAYESDQGWHRVTLRNDVSDHTPEALNDRMERVDLSITNPYNTPRVVRLNFAKEDNVLGITGLSAILCDEEGYPLGVPIQLSKNWHGWVWYHGLTMITVPARTTLRLQYRSVNGHWGGVAAASHAQLCLVGWGVNQQWDEAAIGSWGESICYDPDVNLMRSMIDDVRPLMVAGMGSDDFKKWSWTNNVGGGDFLVYESKDGGRQWNSRMRTRFRRYCPNLTEVTYAGQSHDGKIDVRSTVSLFRTDDITRGVCRFRYDVTQPVEFERFALFQMGSDHYNDHTFGKIAYGNEDGLIEEWEPERGGWRYHRTGIECKGAVPWWSLHEAVSRDTSKSGAWANRGLIVRKWSARINGRDAPFPHASLYGTEDGGFVSALVELSLPPGTHSLQPGDYIDAEVVQVVMPQHARDYYGPNQALADALGRDGNTWRMIHREAAGNALVVAATRGKVERTYPISIRTDNSGRAEFSVRGGLGYVPITFTGVRDYRGFILEQKAGSAWKRVDQSVHGNDFWQTDYDPATRRWEITYTMPLDSSGDEDAVQSYRFRSRPDVREIRF